MSDRPTGRAYEGGTDSTAVRVNTDPLPVPGHDTSAWKDAARTAEGGLFPSVPAPSLPLDVPGAVAAPEAESLPAVLGPEPAAPTRDSVGVWRALRSFFWMDQRLAQARRDGYGPGQPGWDFFGFGRSALAFAGQLGESTGGRIAALLLYRDACALLVRAQLARAGIDPSGISNQECWSRLVALPTGTPLEAGLTEEQRQLVTAVFSAQAEGVLAKQPEDQHLASMRTLTALAHGLGQPMVRDLKGPRRVLVSRWLRVGVTGLMILTAGWILVREPNLALHRPVKILTRHPTFGVDASHLVDGDRINLGFHTIEAPNQTATIDLEGVHRVSKVVVYNRTDCCKERAVPLKLEVSEDGKTFQEVAKRAQTFDQWTATFASTKARYVRLTCLAKSNFHLSEVEVY